MGEHNRCLVLNADYSAIGLIPWQDAVTLDFKNLIRVVDFYQNDYIGMSDGGHYPVLAVAALLEYKNPKTKRIPFSRKNVFIRDRLKCQYCGNRFHPGELTFDHVVPRCRWNGGDTPTQWKNIVSACYPCNNKKADKTINDCRMKLIRTPKEPDPRGYVLGLAPWTTLQPEWLPYLPRHYKEMILDLGETL